MKKLVFMLGILALVSCNREGGGKGNKLTISGTITVDPALAPKVAPTDRLFIIARRVEGGPPLAVQKIAGPQFPLRYWLTQDDVMIPGIEFKGEANILARLDKDGQAGPPQAGDLEGTFQGNPAKVGDQQVDIVINKLY